MESLHQKLFQNLSSRCATRFPIKTQPSILILTDGKMGDLVQCRGVAAELSTPEYIREQVVTPNWLTALPLPNMPLSAVDRQQDFFALDPDIIIASGRRAIPYLKAFANNPAKKAFTVFLKNPRFGRKTFDFIWCPTHDGISGENIFSTLTAPHVFTQQVLEDAKKSGKQRFGLNDEAVTGIILGGNSGSVDWDSLMTVSFAAPLAQIDTSRKLLVTSSRRTPLNLKHAVELALKNHDCWFWDDEGENPYSEILAVADQLIVTGDSHNMVSEAVATDASVYVFRPRELHKKLVRFLDSLKQETRICSNIGELDQTQVRPLNATPKIAAEIVRRMKARP